MKLFIQIIVLLVLTGCAPAIKIPSPELRLLTWNVRNGKGMDNLVDYDRTAAVINNTRADFIALQELDSATTRSGGSVVLDQLAARTGLHAVYGPAISFQGGKYGVGILSREKALRHYTLPLPGREEKRVLLVAEFSNLVIFCTHFSLTAADAEASAAILNTEAEKFSKPVYLMGDLNVEPGSKALAIILSKWSLLSGTAPTFPAGIPDRCIDYILVLNNSMKVLTTAVLPEPVASDHRPVLVSLKK